MLGLKNSLGIGKKRTASAAAGFDNSYSLDFDGSDDIITLDSATFAGPGSWQFWINTAQTANQIILSQTPYSYVFYKGTGTAKLRVTWPTGFGSGSADYTIPVDERGDGEWKHIVVTNHRPDVIGTTGETKIYWNGSLVATKSGTGLTSGDPYVEADVVSYIGGQASGTNDFNGNIDEVAFWSSVTLDAEAITVLYNSGEPIDLSEDFGDYDNSGDLSNWWRMGDGDTYPTIEDNVGSIDGTMTNMTAEDIVEDVPS